MIDTDNRPSFDQLQLHPDAVWARQLLGSKSYQEDLSRIRGLQQQFDAGINQSDSELLHQNYNPVLARFSWEQCKTPEEKKAFKVNELKQLETALRERYRTPLSVTRYRIDSRGRVFNELLPDQPFQEILQRGLAYRRAHNSPELEREEGEVKGFIKRFDYFGDRTIPIEQLKRRVSISGPGLVPDSAYGDNFVDVYEAERDDQVTGDRWVKVTRHASSLNYDQYMAKARQSDEGYFTGFKGPLDAHFAENDLEADPGEILGYEGFITSEEKFRRIWNESKPLAEALVSEISDDRFNPADIKIYYNALLRKSQEIKDWEDGKGKRPLLSRVRALFRNIKDEALYLASQFIEKVKAGCGLSGAFALGNDRVREALSNSVAKFALPFTSSLLLEKKSYYCHQCGACGEVINQDVYPGQMCPGKAVRENGEKKCKAVRQCV